MNPEGLNHTAGSRRLQRVTEKVTRADLSPRAGLFSQDFRDPMVWKRQGVCRPRDSSHVCPVPPGRTSPRELPPAAAPHRRPFIQIGSGPFPPGLGAHANTFSAGPLGLVPEKMVAFCFGAQKMQINNSLHLHEPKTDPPWQAGPPAASLGVPRGVRVGGGTWAMGGGGSTKTS